MRPRKRAVQLWCDEDFRKMIRVQAASANMSIHKYTKTIASKADEPKKKRKDPFDFSF